MLTKACAATGLVVTALGGALLMSSPANASGVNVTKLENSNSSTNENTNTNTASEAAAADDAAV